MGMVKSEKNINVRFGKPDVWAWDNYMKDVQTSA